MKQFNLEEYLNNTSRKIVTRDGRDVRIICTDFNNPDFPVIGEIKDYKWPLSFTINGETIKGRQLSNDLFFVSKKKERWINLYYDKIRNKVYFGKVFKIKEKAKKMGKSQNNYVITIPIEWED